MRRHENQTVAMLCIMFTKHLFMLIDMMGKGLWKLENRAKKKKKNLPPGITGFLRKDMIFELHPEDQEL